MPSGIIYEALLVKTPDMKTKIIVFSLLCINLFLASCNKDKDDEAGTATLSILMTDAPVNYDAVYIDLQQVEITGNSGNATNLDVNAGIYNLLDFANGADTLIATGNLQAGMIEQVRLILGSNNSVVVDSVSYPLSTPSAQQSGLKLQVHKSLAPGVSYMLLLDFDAAQSIVITGNGTYQLKPVIRVVDIAISGSIKGKVSPLGVHCTIDATDGSATYSSVTDSNGEFLVQGVPAGTYNVTVTPDLPLQPVTINNVVVTTGAVTDVGVISF